MAGEHTVAQGEVAVGAPTGSGWIAGISTYIGNRVGIAPEAVTSVVAVVLVSLLALGVLPLMKRLGYRGENFKKTAALVFIIVSYSVSSGFLLLLNKVAVTYVPLPSILLLSQLATSAAFVKGLAVTGVVEADALEWTKVKAYVVVVFSFFGTLLSNVHALQHVPVDTVICFRSSMPLVICVIEYFYLGRELPSMRSTLSLVGVFAGVSVYALHDINFTWIGYTWIAIWYGFAVFEMIIVKKIVDSVPMTTWGRAYYTNLLSLVPFTCSALIGGEFSLLLNSSKFPSIGLWALALSCVAGVGMSYFGFALRQAVSATSFSIVGNLCKVLTITMNLLVWSNHSDLTGTVALFVCMGMAALYQQPPLRVKAKPALSDDEGERSSLIEKGLKR